MSPSNSKVAFNSIGKSYLVPRSFYFVIEHNDLWGETGLEDVESYHVELAVYRLSVDGKDLDRDKTGKELNPHVIRSWVEQENPKLKIVYASRGKDGKVETPVDFTGELVAYPLGRVQADMGLGVLQKKDLTKKDKLPALVVATLDLEPDREHVAFARVHDGIQWGPWERIAQSRLDFVRFEDTRPIPTVRDVQISDPHPIITAWIGSAEYLSEVPEEPWNVPKTGSATANNLWIDFNATITDTVLLKRILINGTNILAAQGSSRENGSLVRGQITWNTRGSHALLRHFRIPITEGCARLEIIAENRLGNRSQAIQVFLPKYNETGKVEHYTAARQKFYSELRTDDHDQFQIRFYSIPYRMFEECFPFSPDGNIDCHLLVGNDGSRSVELAPSDVFQEPYFGPTSFGDIWPQALKVHDDDAWRPSVIVSVHAEQNAEGVVRPVADTAGPKAMGLGCVWTSEPITLLEHQTVSSSWELGVARGDLLEAHVVTSTQEDLANTNFGRVLTPKAAAADIYPVSALPDRNGQPVSLSALKNGDVIRLRAFSILSEPTPRYRPKPYDFEQDGIRREARGWAPWPIVDTYRSAPEPECETPSVEALIVNWTDRCEENTDRRDELIGTRTPVYLIPQRISFDEDSTPDESDPHRPNPGTLSMCLWGEQAVRLLTQAYREAWLPGAPVPLNAAHGPETLHQILPNGYLGFTMTGSLDTGDPSEAQGSSGEQKQHESIPTALRRGFRVLEMTKRWFIDDRPSVQPALAGTNPRVGGPGTHRVGGLHHKQDDGSVYVHNGELFQSAEDLHAKGKFLEFLFRRVHMSHSLFTTAVGRNWDFVGNMRLVEMLNGDVYLMNGEAEVERYPSLEFCGVDPDGNMLTRPAIPQLVECLSRADGFNYERLFDLRQYYSPAGAYRVMLKAKPIHMDGLPVSANGGEEDRFYLAGKHGMVWTFVEDVRFHSDAENASIQSEPHEPPPGVRRQYLLSAIHHRVQQSYLKFQRDEKGLVRGIIDDMGRVTRLDYVKPGHEGTSFDMFLDTVEDFAGRKLSFRRSSCFDLTSAVASGITSAIGGFPGVVAGTWGPMDQLLLPRNLERVDGPAKDAGTDALPLGMKYEYVDDPAKGSRHRLKSVTDPRENAKGKRYYLKVDDWDHGQVTTQSVRSLIAPESPASAKLPADLRHPITFTHILTPPGNPAAGEREVEWFQDARRMIRHAYRVRKEASREFAEVVSHSVTVRPRRGGASPVQDAVTRYTYNDAGEITLLVRPSGGQLSFRYQEDGAGAGNLLEESVLSGGVVVSKTTYEYAGREGRFDLHFNLPGKVYVIAYKDDNQPLTMTTTTEYDNQGNVFRVTEEPLEDTSRTWPVDALAFISSRQRSVGTVTQYAYYPTTGQLMRVVDPRRCTTWYSYYQPQTDHVPGDAHDRAGMLAETNRNGLPLAYNPTFSEFESMVNRIPRRPNQARDADFATDFKPDLLGNPEVTVDACGFWHLQKFNKLSQIVKDRGFKNPAGVANDPRAWADTAQAWQEEEREPKHGIEYAYTPNDELSQVTVPAVTGQGDSRAAKRVNQTDYDSLGNIVLSCILRGQDVPADLVNAARHDSLGNPFKTVDEAGTITTFVYDDRGLCLETTFTGAAGESGVDEYAYDIDGNRTFHSDPCGWCEAWIYDEAGRPTHALSKTGLVTALVYGHGGMLWTETQYETTALEPHASGANGNSTPTQGMNALKESLRGLAEQMAFRSTTGLNLSAERVYADAQYWRDEHGNVWKTSRLFESQLPRTVGTAATRADFWTAWTQDGLPLLEANDRGITRKFIYDRLGRATSEFTGPYETKYTFDGMDRPLRVSSFDDTLIHAYDAFGGVLKTESTNLAVVLNESTYDFSGQVLYKRTLPQGENVYQTDSHQYDAAGRLHVKDAVYSTLPVSGLTGRITPIRQKTTWTFDNRGRLARVETEPDSLGGKTRLVYAPSLFGPRSATLNGLGMERAVEYSARGDKLSWTDANGTRFAVSHDGAGQVASLVATGGSGSRTMHNRIIARDAAGRPERARDQQLMYYSRPFAAVPATGAGSLIVENEFGYDTLGNPTQETQSFHGGRGALVPPPRSISYAHTSTGARARTTLPDARGRRGEALGEMELGYESDVLNRPSAAAFRGGFAGSGGTTFAGMTYHPRDAKIEKQNVSPLPSGSDSTHTPAGAMWTGIVPRYSVDQTAHVGIPSHPGNFISAEMRGQMRQTNGARRVRQSYIRWGVHNRAVKGYDVSDQVGLTAPTSANPIMRATTGCETTHKGLLPNGLGVSERQQAVSKRTGAGDNYIAKVKTETTVRTMLSSGYVSATNVTREERDENESRRPIRSESTSNTYSDFGRASRLPDRVTAEGIGRRNGDDSNTRAISRFSTGVTYGEPDAATPAIMIGRDVFGQAVSMTRNSSQGERCLMRYDTLGRLALKETPASLTAPEPVNVDTIVVEVKNPRPWHLITEPSAGATDSFVGLAGALSWIKQHCDTLNWDGSTIASGNYLVKISTPIVAEAWDRLSWASTDDSNTYQPADRTTRVPKYRFDRITFEKAPGWHGNLGSVTLPKKCRAITFKGFTFDHLEMEECSSIVLDGCTFGTSTPPVTSPAPETPLVHVKGSCPGLQVQNCTLRSPRIGVQLEDVKASTALFAHNLFDATGGFQDTYHAIEFKLTDYGEINSLARVSVGAMNNIFLFPRADYRAFAVTPESSRERFLAYAWVYGDHNIYYGPRNLTFNGKDTGFRGCFFRYWDQTSGIIDPKQYDLNSIWLSPDRGIQSDHLLSGLVGAGMGYPDVPAMLSTHSPVLWDKNGRLRDPKNPTIGPIEQNVPGTADRVLTRYVHDQQHPVTRESYRYVNTDGGTVFDRADVTRFLCANPSGVGPVLYADDDGVVDVSLPDRSGLPWVMYRSRESCFTVPTYPGDQNTHPYGHFSYFAPRVTVSEELRGTGMLKPPQYEGFPYTDFAPWYMRVLEPDVLMGRRGVAGWNGLNHDRGLWIDLEEFPMSFWGSIDWKSGETWLYIAVGALAVIGGVLLTIATAGTAAAFLGMVAGGALMGAGAGYGITGAATHDPWEATKAAGIGALAGAVGGAASYGAMALVATAAGFGGASTSAVALATHFGRTGMQVMMGGAAGVAGGYAGGFTGGFVGGLASGQSFDEALYSGRQAGATGAFWGAVLGAGIPLAAAGLKALGRGIWRAHTRLNERYEWSAVRSRLGAEGWAQRNQQIHHWAVPRGGTGRLSFRGFLKEQWGRYVPNYMKNLKWNLIRTPSNQWHTAIHGKGGQAYGMMGRLWYGSPTWAKVAAGAALVGYGIYEGMKDD